MKAPLRATNSSTIEKLRVWLAAELEPLEINNNIQYAHHVVTIFLNDVDVEDEPISPPDDYLRELDNLRAGKSLEQKKRAAVQFLKGVIPFENQPIPSSIEQLIEELVERVDATKVKTPKKLLGPLSVDVYRRQMGSKRSRPEQESFDEAFPSLSVETRMAAVTVTVKTSACADGWLRSSISNENSQRSRRRSAAARKITFVDKSEDAVCVRTGLLHLVPVSDKHLPSPVTIQVDESSLETGIFSGRALQHHYESEWKSAFFKVLPTAKLYSPKKIQFPLPLDVSSPAIPNSWPTITIICNDSLGQSAGIPRLADKVDLLDENSPKAFLHLEHRAPATPPNKLFALDDDDLEVSNLISWDRVNNEQMKRRKNELALVKRQENHVARRKENRNRQRNASHASVPVGGSYSGNGQSSPLLGAVGGAEVKTDDLVGFAMNQIVQFERIRSRTDGHGPNRQKAFDVVTEPDENVLAIHIGWGYGDEDGNGRDSGMFPDREEEPSRLNLDEWTDGVSSPSGWLESASVWRKASRKTPGCAVDDTDDGVTAPNSECSMDGGAKYQNWNGWGDPIPIPGSSWDSMIRRDVFHLPSPPNTTTNTHFAVQAGSIYCPPELSSCVKNSNVSQILQSAFVNSMFAQGMSSDPLVTIQSSQAVLNCSELEQRWLSYRSDETLPTASHSRLNVVRGRTCSNWLEGVCHLGIECPFSHPR